MDSFQKINFLDRIKFYDSISYLKDVDFVIEAASENFELKKSIFIDLAQHTPERTILATNTSSISISKIGGIIPDRA